MVTPAAVSMVLAFIVVAVFLVLIGYIFYDRGRIAVEWRDLETGDVDITYEKPTEKGLEGQRFGPDHMLRLRSEFMSTWHGSWLPWTYPMVTVNARTGRQIITSDRVTIHVAEDEDAEYRDDEVDELLQVAWPHVYWKWLDSDVVEEALEAQKSVWQKLAGALIIGLSIMSIAFVLVVWMGGS